MSTGEWEAIRFYCDNRYRRRFISRRGGMLSEGISDKLKGLWNSAKEKARGFLDGIKNIAGNLLPGSFLIGLSKLGDAGKRIWEFVSTLAGNAYSYLIGAIDQAKAYIEKQKEQIVANVINLILKVVYSKDVNLYNQIVTACKAAGINTGLEVAAVQQQPQQQQVREGVVGTAIKGVNYLAGEKKPESLNPREQVANLVEKALNVIKSVLTPELKEKLISKIFPFKSDSAGAIGMTLILPLAQASGSLSFDTLVAFVTQVVDAVKHRVANAAGKVSLFREHKKYLLEIKSSFVSLLVNNFDSVTGAIVGLIKGSNIEMIISAAMGNVGAGKAVVSQLLKLLVDVVKKAAGDESEEELNDNALEKATDFLMGESKVSLSKILYGE